MIYSEIKEIADRVVKLLAPCSDRIEIAGSIRRKKDDCGDIEVVYIPSKSGQWLAYDIIGMWRKIKGDAWGKYTQRMLPEGVKLDLFRAVPENWGHILAIRTGSADFSKALAARWVKKGYHSDGGMLRNSKGTIIPIPEEQVLFDLLALDWVDPERRH